MYLHGNAHAEPCSLISVLEINYWRWISSVLSSIGSRFISRSARSKNRSVEFCWFSQMTSESTWTCFLCVVSVVKWLVLIRNSWMPSAAACCVFTDDPTSWTFILSLDRLLLCWENVLGFKLEFEVLSFKLNEKLFGGRLISLHSLLRVIRLFVYLAHITCMKEWMHHPHLLEVTKTCVVIWSRTLLTLRWEGSGINLQLICMLM